MIDFKQVNSRVNPSSSIDYKELNSRLPKSVVKVEEPKVERIDAGQNYRNLLAGGDYQVYNKTVPVKKSEPLKYVQQTADPFKSLMSNFGEDTMANSTSKMESESFGLKDIFGMIRATTDWASLPVSLLLNEATGAFTLKEDDKYPKSEISQSTPAVMTSDRVDTKYILDATKEMALNDIKTGGEWSMSQAAQGYLKARGITDGRDVKIQDIAVLGSFGIFHMFGDLVLGIPAMKTLKEFALWKKVGQLEKPLKESVTITKGITRDIPIAQDLKIKVVPKQKSVIFEGYIKRGSKGEILNAPLELDTIISETSKATGREVVLAVKGNNLILKATDNISSSMPVSKAIVPNKIEMAGQELLKPQEITPAKSSMALDFNAEPTVSETPTVNMEIPASKTTTNIDVADKKIDENITKAEYSGNQIAKEAKDLGSDQGGLSDYTLKQIKAEDYKTENIKIDELRKLDKDLDEYLSNNKIREYEGEPFSMNPIVNSKGEVLDGYNRIAQMLADGEREITILKGINKTLSSEIKPDKGEYIELPKSQAETKLKTIETPEQYRLAKSIAPDLNFIMKSSKKFNGYFRPNGMAGEEIAMNRELYKRGKEESKEQYQTRIGKTMAHEIGHLIDYMPDKNLSRGNLIGRLKTLSKFRKNFVDDPAILDERSKIISEINKIVKDDVLLDSQQDKLTEPLFKKLEAINKKIEFNNPRFKDELIKLSRIWKPWEDGLNPSYDGYRKSPAELYADFVSVLFNDPALAQETAPTFYKSFFRSLDKKPDVEREFLSIQAELMGDKPSLMKSRYQMLKDSGQNAQGKFASMVAEKQALNKKPWLEALMREGWYQHAWTRKKGKPIQNLMEVMDRGFNNEIYLWTEKNIKPIMDVLKKADLTASDMDAVLSLERIAKDITRQDVANIKGMDVKTSEEVLSELENILGKEKADIVLKQAQNLRDALKDLQLQFPDLWSSEQLELMKSNNFYAPFNVLFKETNNIGYYIKQSVGNIDKDFSPFVNTLLRAKAVSHFGAKNSIKKNVIDNLLEENAGDIKKAEVSNIKTESGKMIRNVKTPPKDWGLVEIKRDGKIESYYLPDDIANSLNQDNLGTLSSLLKPFNVITKPFKQLYTGVINPGFQVVNFLFRDWGTSSLIFSPEWTRAAQDKSNKGLNILANNTYRNVIAKLNQAKWYWKSFKNIKEKNLFGRYTPIVEEGLKSHIIEVDPSGMYKIDTKNLKEQDAMAVKYILQTLGLKEKGSKLSQLGKQAKGLAQTLEETPKLAAYMHMKQLGVLDDNNLSVIRNHVGSPNFWKQARQSKNISSLFIFYNPIIRGIENMGKKAFVKDAAGKGSRTAFWYRMMRKAIIPALVGVAAEEGFFGDDEKRKWSLLPEYLKGNYLNIPIGIDENGKVKSISVPMDEEARMVHSFVRNIARIALHSNDKNIRRRALVDILAYTGGQVPGTIPAISIAESWSTAMSGGNPYDSFRRQHIFLANELNLPTSEKAKIMTKWTLNQSGILKLNLHDSVESRTVTEQIVSNTPVINRFYRITNRGDYEADQQIIKEERTKAAIELMIKKGVVNNLVEKINKDPKYDPTVDLIKLAKERIGDDKNIKEIASEYKTLNNALQEEYITNFGNVHYRSLMNQSNDAKEKLLLDIYDRGYMDDKEYLKFILTSLSLKIISKEIAAPILVQTVGK
ncbi:MAG TPA: hypothetical protein PKN54_03305 [Candidatus Cloacimonas acidaminovorans]|nr:hypothetical protein [Candidatus Cloacimonas acidaminovorans]